MVLSLSAVVEALFVARVVSTTLMSTMSPTRRARASAKSIVAPSGLKSEPGLVAGSTRSWGGGVTTAEGIGGRLVARQPKRARAIIITEQYRNMCMIPPGLRHQGRLRV